MLLKLCKRVDFKQLIREMNPKESVIHLVDALKNITDLDIAETNMSCDHIWGQEARPSDGQRTQVIY